MGVQTSFLGSVSDDYFGEQIVAGLSEAEVDGTFLKITPGYTSQFAFIAITGQGGNRTVFWHRGTVPHLRAQDVDLSPFSKAKILHVDSLMIEAAQEAAQQARDMELTVVMDAGTMREGSKELISLVDVLIASERFAEPLIGPGKPPDQAVKALYRLGPREVILTRGAKGSMGFRGDEIIPQKAYSIPAIDTTGAGDVYHGAYIYGLLQGWDMPECMRFAAATAALKCKQIGARKGIPNLETVREFLALQQKK